MYQSWAYWKETGIVSGGLYDDKKTCKPYNFPPCNHHSPKSKYDSCAGKHYKTPKCKKSCADGEKYKDSKIKGKTVYSVRGE